MRKDTLATRNLLINTAEKLFAEKGVESTTLFDVFKTSGLKNRSALQYHFKDKVGLINAVLNKHSEAVAQRRSDMLNHIEAMKSYTLYDVIETIVIPMAAQLEDEDGGQEFLSLHSQLMASQQYADLRPKRPEFITEQSRLLNLILPLLPEGSPPEKLIACSPLIDCLLIHGLASYNTRAHRIKRELYLHTIVQGIVDLLQQTPMPE